MYSRSFAHLVLCKVHAAHQFSDLLIRNKYTIEFLYSYLLHLQSRHNIEMLKRKFDHKFIITFDAE